MKYSSLSELKCKEVINVCDGSRLGYVCDAEFDIQCGKLVSISVPGEGKLLGFIRGDLIRIPWDCIQRIGDDIILVSAALKPRKDGCGKKQDR